MKKLSLVFLAFLLSACGFAPLYATADGALAGKLNQVAIANIQDREGQQLRNHLIDRMYAEGRSSNPIARLTVKLKKREIDLGVQKDATTTRRELDMAADYTLVDMKGATLFTGKAHSVVSYGKLAAQYGTVASQENAKDRAIREIGEQIVNRLALYYGQEKEETPSAAQETSP